MNKKLLFQFLIIVLSIPTVFAQKITGTVKDNKGEEIIGAIISIEGTAFGTQTDVKGNYTLNNLPVGKHLVKFSYVGLKSEFKRIDINAGQTITIDMVLGDDPKLLDEAVVVGYGTMRRRELSSAVSKINNKELNDLPVQSFEQALQGKLTGVSVTQGSGLAGSPSIIRIRGISSISASGDPLYVVDGIPITQDYSVYGNQGGFNFNPLANLNPADIESVEVLKDAAATSIYGSRGANGVIMITTKRAEKGKMRVTYNAQIGISRPTARPNLLGKDQLLDLFEEAWINDGNIGKPDLKRYGIAVDWDEAQKHNTNWHDELVQTGVKHMHDVSISKGWEKVSIYSSLSYSHNETFLRGNSYDRFAGRINLDYKITDKLKLTAGTSISNGINNRVYSGWSGGYGQLLSSALPIYPVRNPDGSYFLFNNSDAGFRSNPVMMIDLYKWRTSEIRTINNVAAEYEIIPNLKARVQGNIDYQNVGDNSYSPMELNKNLNIDTVGFANLNARFTLNYNYTAQLNYHYAINKLNKLDFVGGYERQVSTTDGYNFYARDIDRFLRGSDAVSDGRAKGNIVTSQWKFERFFGRINYNRWDRYYVQLAFSYDGSSRFGDNYRYGFFPAISGGWIISEESFLRGNKYLSFLKLRASYGRSGNSDFDPNARFGFFNRNNVFTYNGQPILFPTQLENPNLRWETSWTTNIGIDYGFFNDRINGGIDFYDKVTTDVIMRLNIDPSVGFSNYFDNVGGIRNRGVEFSIKSVNIVSRNFKWITMFNISRNLNEITSTGDYTEDAVSGGTNDTRVVVGSPVGTYYLVRFSHVDPASGRPVYLDKDGNQTFTWDPANRVPIGNILPDGFGGITNTFKYKNWDLSVLFNYQIGGNIYDASAKRQLGVLSFWNSRGEIVDRWQKPGDNAAFPRLTFDPSVYGLPDYWQYNTNMWLYDASFIRLRNLTIGYNIPPNFLKKYHIGSARMAFIATNLLVWTNFPGLDPEIARDGEGEINQSRNMQAQGTYYLNAPQERTYNFQISIVF